MKKFKVVINITALEYAFVFTLVVVVVKKKKKIFLKKRGMIVHMR